MSTGSPRSPVARSPHVGPLADLDPGIGPQPLVELAVADVDRHDLGRAPLEQAVGEPAGGRAGVERPPARTSIAEARRGRRRASRRPGSRSGGGSPASSTGSPGATRRAALSAGAPPTVTRPASMAARACSRLAARPRGPARRRGAGGRAASALPGSAGGRVAGLAGWRLLGGRLLGRGLLGRRLLGRGLLRRRLLGRRLLGRRLLRRRLLGASSSWPEPSSPSTSWPVPSWRWPSWPSHPATPWSSRPGRTARGPPGAGRGHRVGHALHHALDVVTGGEVEVLQRAVDLGADRSRNRSVFCRLRSTSSSIVDCACSACTSPALTRSWIDRLGTCLGHGVNAIPASRYRLSRSLSAMAGEVTTAPGELATSWPRAGYVLAVLPLPTRTRSAGRRSSPGSSSACASPCFLVWQPSPFSDTVEDTEFNLRWAAIPCEVVEGRPLSVSEVVATYQAGDDEACGHRRARGRPFDPDKHVYLSVLFATSCTAACSTCRATCCSCGCSATTSRTGWATCCSRSSTWRAAWWRRSPTCWSTRRRPCRWSARRAPSPRSWARTSSGTRTPGSAR